MLHHSVITYDLFLVQFQRKRKNGGQLHYVMRKKVMTMQTALIQMKDDC